VVGDLASAALFVSWGGSKIAYSGSPGGSVRSTRFLGSMILSIPGGEKSGLPY
jgi:hypothetical protein